MQKLLIIFGKIILINQIIFAFLLKIGSTRKLEDIYWNSLNPMFEISNTDHVKQVELLDRVTILCPEPTASIHHYEYSKLFLVSKEGYEKCKLINETQLGVCTTPEKQSSISVVFRDFSPLSPALQFSAGRSYYVISTSDGTYTGLNKTTGGLCKTRHMKMKFEILKDLEKTNINNDPVDSSPSLFSILPPLNNDSTFPPILYIIHTSDASENSISSASLNSAVYERRFDVNNRRSNDRFYESERNFSTRFLQTSITTLFSAIIVVIKITSYFVKF